MDTGATEVLLIPQNSFNFLHEAIQQLANFGCDLGSFLTITAVSFDYFSANDNLPYVSWTPGTPAPSEVYNW